ncbi:MAG: hypothetical protein HZB14_06590 [Actinobacteria bacterium]|nr:hypothetical protein [Actinomycetota bacterium]
MNTPQKIFTADTGLHDRLPDLDLTVSQLHQIVRAGAVARRRSSPLHPRNHAGFNDWSECIAESRRLLLPTGWKKEDADGLPLIVHPSGAFAFTVATGDGATGDVSQVPRTKYPKGAKTLREVAKNQQPSLFEEKAEPLTKATRDFWILLRARNGNEVALEFSKPSIYAEATKEKAYVSGWSQRLIVPSISIYRQVPSDLLDQSTGEIDIQIDKR